MTDETLQKLLQYDDRAWYYVQLMKDPLFDRIGAQERKLAIVRAMEIGTRMARDFLAQNPDADFEQWFKGRKIEFSVDERTQSFPIVLFAAVTTSPERIRIHMDAIRSAYAALTSNTGRWASGHSIDRDAIQKIVLAHECFHILDEQDPHEKYRVDYTIGPFHRRATILQFDEIEAAAFAKECCGLDFNPGILDVALLSAYDKKRKDTPQIFLTALQNASEQLREFQNRQEKRYAN